MKPQNIFEQNSITRCFCTFTPGVEQHVDVICRVVGGNSPTVWAVRFHCELITANDGCGWRIHGELSSVVDLFHNSSLPTIVLQVVHQRDDDMGSLWHCRQRPWGGERRHTSPTWEVQIIADCWHLNSTAPFFMSPPIHSLQLRPHLHSFLVR